MKRWILLALVACAPHRSLPPNRRGVDGKPSDVHTVDGVYGTGTRWFEGACGDATAHAAAFEKFRLEMRAEIPFVCFAKMICEKKS